MKTRLLIGLILLAGIASAQVTRALTNIELRRGYFTLTIASGAAVSDKIQLGGACTPYAVQIPSVWTTADLTVLEGMDGYTMGSVRDEFKTERTIGVHAVSTVIRLSPADYYRPNGFQLRSGTAETPVNQAAARSLHVLCR
jgi:hypothetical protein